MSVVPGRPAPPLLVLVLVVLTALLLSFPPAMRDAAAQAGETKFPPLTGRVVDEADLLTPAERQSLTEALKAHEDATGNQVVVATVRSLDGRSIEDFGYQLGRVWGIGREGKDDGVLLIVAPTERKVRIEVGYGLEGVLTDAATRLIIERIMVPAFRSGQYGPGIVAGTGAILKMLAGEGEPQAMKDKPAKAKDAAPVLGPLLFLLLFLVMLWLSYRNQRSRGLLGRRGRDGRWIVLGGMLGGLGGGGWGRGGGGGGGFGGGGGSFGGGGASGDW